MAERRPGDQPQDAEQDESKPPRIPLRSKEAKQATLRVLALLRPYRWQLIAAALLLIVTNGLGLLFPLVIRTLLNTILEQHQSNLLNLIAVVLLGVFLAQAVLGAVQGYLVTALGERLSFDLRTRLFRHLQRLPLSFFDSRRTGELMSRVTNDVTLLQTSLTNNVLPIVSQVVMLVGSIVIAVAINWRLMLVIVVIAPLIVLSFSGLGRRVRRTTRGVQEGLGEAGVVLEEALSAQRVVKAFARENYEEGRFNTRMTTSLQQALRRAFSQALLGPISQFIGFGAMVVVLWFGGQEVLAGRLTAGDLIAFIFYLFMVVGPLVSFGNLYAQLQAALAAAERIFAVLDEPEEAAIMDAAAPALPPIKGQLAFENVSFTYPLPPDKSEVAAAGAGAASDEARPAILHG
ncbi:MAG TPA: ABC transporter transmembrane domain-containing protein, partial [Ktedonobacterales bacterium]|nr:ABC transporter transmembrane domain-containing protein [Ktedonobacterales bacterium]